ncbi:MAG: hypothetical protein R3F14_19560 [Polyangiaceae bacterium]
MRFRFDHFIKKLLREALYRHGDVSTEVEVAVDAQRIDVLFYPRARRRAGSLDLGLLGRMASTPCLFEVFRVPPDAEQRREAIRKLLAWQHLTLLRAREKRGEPGSSPPPMPVLWILSSTRPGHALDGLTLTPVAGWPEGVYSTPQEEVPVRLVVLSELPLSRDTLALRLMGRGVTAERAALELAELSASSWERRLLAPLMVNLQKKLANNPPDDLTEEERELLVNGLKLIEAIEKKGQRQGRSEGRRMGREEGELGVFTHQFARKLGAPLSDSQQQSIAQRMKTLGADRLGEVVLDLDAAALAAWLADPDAR